MIKLNYLGSDRLVDLYDALFVTLPNDHLPELCSSSVQLPIMKLTTKTYELARDDFGLKSGEENKDQEIEFKQFFVKINYYKSYEFLELSLIHI